MKHTTGKIHIAVSSGQYPAYYAIGPTVPPFADLENNGPVLATFLPNNPKAAGDAQLFACAARLKEILGDLVKSLNDHNTAESDSLRHAAVELLQELDSD